MLAHGTAPDIIYVERSRTMTQQAQESGRPAPAVQPRLLIAEDNELVRKQLKSVLEADLGVRVDTTADGQQALDALQSNYYSVFLTDLQMPRFDGLELIKKIQEKAIPVTSIIFTGHGSIDSA